MIDVRVHWLEFDADAPVANATATGAIAPISLTAPTGRVLNDTVEDLIYKLLANRQELDPVAGVFRVYDDDGSTVLFQAAAWEDADGTRPYRGQQLQRIDRLQ